MNKDVLESTDLNLLLMGALRGTAAKKLKPEIKKQLANEYPVGTQLKLDSHQIIEIVMDVTEDDVYYDKNQNAVVMDVICRDLSKKYQNINLNLLKHGTCARDKYNQFPGMQHYTRDDWRSIRKIPDIAKQAYDCMSVIIIDFEE